MLPAFLLPLLGGAAAGAGLGALTSEDGLSDDAWWQGMLLGGLGGGLGGHLGLLGGGGSTIAPATTAGGLGTYAAPGIGSLAPSTGGMLGLSGVGSESALSMLTPELLKGSAAMGSLPGQTLAGNIFTNTPGMFAGMGGLGDLMSMPSNDTLMGGLLASKIFGALKSDPEKEKTWGTPQQARLGPITKMGAPMQLSRRGGQPGGAFMGGGRGGQLGSRRYS